MIADAKGETLLRSITIKDWVDATAGTKVKVGLTTESARERAFRLSVEVLDGKRPDLNDDLPDVLHALVSLVEESGPSSVTGGAVEKYYSFIEGLSWASDGFGEAATLKTRLAYQAWKSCLRNWDYSALKRWERLCLASLRCDQVIKEFLALPIDTVSDQIRRRFLLDRPTLLALCARLAVTRNRVPSATVTEAKELYGWIASHFEMIGGGDDLLYFLGEVAVSIAVSTRHLGHFAAADSWLVTAEHHFGKLSVAEPWLARVALCRLVGFYDVHQGHVVLNAIDSIDVRLERVGMVEELCLAKHLRAGALKATGRTDEALRLFEELRGAAHVSPDLRCQILLNIAEIQSFDLDVAERAVREAFEVVQTTDSAMSRASLFCLAAEISRDRGDLTEAAKHFRASVETYQYAEMSVLAAYVRVLLADALLLAGRDRDAIAEVAAALPVLERERVLPDIAHALALLRKCVDQKRLEPPVLARLRQQLRPWQ